MNKLQNFPTTYYMSLEESIDRQKNLTDQFKQYGITPIPIISKRFSDSDDKVTGKYVHQLNAGTTGCCISHLKAIKEWYETTDDDYAFFCEDDLSLETVQYWNFTWEEFIHSLPEDAECVQLLTIRDEFKTFSIRERYWNDWGATAYIITRDYSKKIIDTYIKGDIFHLEVPNSDIMPLIENILFTNLGKCYTVPLFVEDIKFESTFSKEHDNDVNEGQKNNHYVANEKVLNYWKSKEKNMPNTSKTELEELLINYSLDTENADHNFALGLWYENEGHTAPALSYFLRCAERSEDNNLAYEALIRGSYCYDKQGTRDGSAKSLLEQALCLMPKRPEAYFLLSRFAEKRQWWQDCYIYADQGLMFADHDSYPPLRTDVEYPSKYGLLFEKAISGYWWGKDKECKEIFLDLRQNYSLSEQYLKVVDENLSKLGIEIPQIKIENIVVDENFFDTEYQNACNTPSDINQNLPVLYEIAKECSHITEFGVRTGSSTRAFLNTNASLRSYDLSIDSHLNSIFKKAIEFGKDVSYIEADVLNVEIEETDLLFIDTWHQYEQLKQELKLHGTKSKKYIAFHDTQTYGVTGENCSNASSGEIVTGYIENPIGLLPAIIEFVIENPEWQFKIHKTNNNGLTVLEKKKLNPIPVIGVPIVNGFHWLQRLIDSIDYPVKELCVINNNGRGELTEQLDNLSKINHEFIEKIKVCHLPANIGCSGAWNLIIKTHMMEPYWVIVNNDVAFTPGLLKEMVERSKNEEYGLIKGKEFQWDLFLIKDWVVEKCGLFDENFYPAYAEDCDYFLRLLNADIKLDYLEIKHLHGDSDYENSGSQTIKLDVSLKDKLAYSNEVNVDYISTKWGPYWRGLEWEYFNPYKNPFDKLDFPISYTYYDLEFVRRKNLGF